MAYLIFLHIFFYFLYLFFFAYLIFCIFLFKPSHMYEKFQPLIDWCQSNADGLFYPRREKKLLLKIVLDFCFSRFKRVNRDGIRAFDGIPISNQIPPKVQQRSLMSFSTFGPRLNIEKLVKLSNYQTIRQMPHDQESVGWNSSEFWACLSPSIISRMYP